MKTPTAAPVSTSTRVTDAYAKEARKKLELMAPAVGEPVDYDDCILLSLWQRIANGERVLPVVALNLLDKHSARVGESKGLRDRAPHRWIIGRLEAAPLVQALTVQRISLMLADPDSADDQSREAILVGEGLTTALFASRGYFAGSRLLNFIDLALAQSKK
jgi:hypothetical protein